MAKAARRRSSDGGLHAALDILETFQREGVTCLSFSALRERSGGAPRLLQSLLALAGGALGGGTSAQGVVDTPVDNPRVIQGHHAGYLDEGRLDGAEISILSSEYPPEYLAKTRMLSPEYPPEYLRNIVRRLDRLSIRYLDGFNSPRPSYSSGKVFR